jgi:hypothetical protein
MKDPSSSRTRLHVLLVGTPAAGRDTRAASGNSRTGDARAVNCAGTTCFRNAIRGAGATQPLRLGPEASVHLSLLVRANQASLERLTPRAPMARSKNGWGGWRRWCVS